MNPDVISRYEIARKLGDGGMGSVFLAHDPRFPRDVALKLLHTGMTGDPALRERFEREAQTIASLEHHAIVPVYDFGEYNGQLYLVMRLMRGGTLRHRLQGGPLPPNTVSDILQRIASALDKAHEKGVVHRDLKPANILFDDEDKPYLSDFGIVKLYEGTAKLTRTGGILGTPAYMSPEQGLGNPVDKRSDIYSLGVVLYEMATGRVPFQADTAIATVLKHVQESLPPPRSINPSVSQNVERVIVKALAKQPEHRFGSAGEMAAALRAGAHSIGKDNTVIDVRPEGGSARDEVPGPSPGRFSRRSLAAIGATLVLLLALAAGGWWAASGQGEESEPSRTPEGPQTVVAVASTASQTPSATDTPRPSPSASPSVTPTSPPSPTATPSPTSSLWVPPPGQQRDQIAFVSNRSGRDAIYAMDLESQTVRQITEPDPGKRHWWPAWCGRDRIVFEAGDDPYEGE